jgi:hypothetical protein
LGSPLTRHRESSTEGNICWKILQVGSHVRLALRFTNKKNLSMKFRVNFAVLVKHVEKFYET